MGMVVRYWYILPWARRYGICYHAWYRYILPRALLQGANYHGTGTYYLLNLQVIGCGTVVHYLLPCFIGCHYFFYGHVVTCRAFIKP